MSYLFWLYQWIRGEVLAIPGRVIALVFVISLLVVPFIASPFLLRMFTIAAIYAIYAASWDILAGFTGQLNLGHALFFGVAAYTVGLLNIHFGFTPWATIPLGGVAAVMAGLIAGAPALRLRGIYLALVTLSFPLILTGILFMFPDFTGGEYGLYGISGFSGSHILNYYIVSLTMVGSVFVMWKFTDAKSKIVRVGIILHAIREDEITARASGIDTTRYKLLAFAVSGFFAGIAGGFYAHIQRVAGPSNLEMFFSFQAILWSIFGGITTIYGGVAGVYILYPILELLRLNPFLEIIRFILFAIILIFTISFMPEGITTWVRDRIEVDCPRCKLINATIRRYCRACRAPLHLEKTDEEGGTQWKSNHSMRKNPGSNPILQRFLPK